MTKPEARDAWHDDVDLDRLYGQRRCIAASWALVVLLLIAAIAAPAAAELIEITLGISD